MFFSLRYCLRLLKCGCNGFLQLVTLWENAYGRTKTCTVLTVAWINIATANNCITVYGGLYYLHVIEELQNE